MEGLLLYKLIILYMLDRIDYTLTNSQLCNFILDKGYTTMFNIHEAISELIDSGFIQRSTLRDTTHYQITEQGETALSYFENRIPNAIKKDIMEFFEAEKINLKNEAQVYADYYQKDTTEYVVQCVIKERKETLVDIKLSVPTKNQAVSICDNWREKSASVYSFLVNELWTND